MFHSVKTRIIATFLIVVAIVLVVSTIASFVLVDRQEQKAYEGYGIGAALACATMVDYAVTDIEDFHPGNPDYDDCCAALRELCRIEDMAYMYVYTVNEENVTMTYIMAVSGDPARDAIVAQARPYGTVVSTGHLSEKNLDAVEGKHGEYIAAYSNAFGNMVDGFAAQAEQFDDLTAIALMRHADADASIAAGDEADGPATLHELDVALSSFSSIREDIMNGPEKSMRLRACLACEEMFANIVSYSKARHIFYSVSERDGRLVVVLEDDGAPFDPLMADPVEKEFEELDDGGMGIALTKEIADGLSYQRNAGRNVLTLEFDLASAPL